MIIIIPKNSLLIAPPIGAEDAPATHPCERVFGTCQAGATCPYKDAPRGACVAFLKGKCRFGVKCREPHVVGHQGKYVSALHPCVRVYGSCRYGDQCEYANLPSDTCVKFLKGRCTFGDRCNEQHTGNMFGFMVSSLYARRKKCIHTCSLLFSLFKHRRKISWRKHVCCFLGRHGSPRAARTGNDRSGCAGSAVAWHDALPPSGLPLRGTGLS